MIKENYFYRKKKMVGFPFLVIYKIDFFLPNGEVAFPPSELIVFSP